MIIQPECPQDPVTVKEETSHMASHITQTQLQSHQGFVPEQPVQQDKEVSAQKKELIRSKEKNRIQNCMSQKLTVKDLRAYGVLPQREECVNSEPNIIKCLPTEDAQNQPANTTQLTPEQLVVLEESFKKHYETDPLCRRLPSRLRKISIAQDAKLTVEEVTIWF